MAPTVEPLDIPRAMVDLALSIRAANISTPTESGRLPVVWLDVRKRPDVAALLTDRAHPPIVKVSEWYHLAEDGRMRYSLLKIKWDRLTCTVRFDWPRHVAMLRAVAVAHTLGLTARLGYGRPAFFLTGITPETNGLNQALHAWDHRNERP